MTIGVLDYGLGNVASFINSFRRIGVAAVPVRSNDELWAVDRIVLPGVGAFDRAMALLTDSGLTSALHRRVMYEGVPILGVCVGLQMMCRSSAEGTASGLGWFDATVERFPSEPGAKSLAVPHLGWNEVVSRGDSLLFDSDQKDRYYFLHSYYVNPAADDIVAATTSYGQDFSSALAQGNLLGVQFHPEKSHEAGLQLLRRFAEA